jgi:hypothetical protein
MTACDFGAFRAFSLPIGDESGEEWLFAGAKATPKLIAL